MGAKDAYTDGTYQGEDRAAQLYSDIDLFFGPKNGSKDINRVTNFTAVKRSVRNLVLTNFYEKPFHPEIGSGVRDILFEPMTPITAYVLTMKIEEVIENFEPRARLVGVRAIPNLDNNAYNVTIEFYVVNAPNRTCEYGSSIREITIMATTRKRLSVTEFDFDEVKDNLKLFMRNQTEFKDYDFEGSGLSAPLDVLAYNTHYLGFNANMLANEMFLDSSQLRSSVVSHAKTLGYTTRSATAAKATVDVFLNTSNTSATMPAGTVFTSSVGDTSYQFVTIQSVTASLSGSSITFDNVDIYEGSYVSTRYTADTQNVEQRFIINDDRADTTTISITVQNSASDTTSNTYTLATDISGLTSTSNVYFIQEVEDGKYEVYFGDGILGSAIEDGNIIIINYVVTNKGASNGADTSYFSSLQLIQLTVLMLVTVSQMLLVDQNQRVLSLSSTTHH